MGTSQDDKGSGIWECYSCGYLVPSLNKGFSTQCPRCGSYELHLSDEAKSAAGTTPQIEKGRASGNEKGQALPETTPSMDGA